MPLPLPRLDRRTFAELSAEGRALIPLYAPGWTDHNAHDPGITLLELLAAAVEAESYRLDRTPPAAFRAFLRLVGVEPRAAQPAQTVLVLTWNGPGGELALPAGLQVEDDPGRTRFQTTAPLTLSSATLIDLRAGPEAALADVLAANAGGAGFAPFGPEPAPGCALYLGFDRPLAAETVELTLYVWAGPPAHDHALRERLAAEWAAARAECERHITMCEPGPDGRVEPVTVMDEGPCPCPPDWRLHFSARTAWEYHAAGGIWRPLEGLLDETRGLTLSGPVRFHAPPDQAPGGPDPARFYLRCRLASGHFPCPPRIMGLALNAVAAQHAAARSPEQLGTSTGGAGQRVALGQAPVAPGSTRLLVQPDDGHEADWVEVLHWDHSGPHDRHYLLDPERGELSFGDGRVGRVPPAGAAVSANYSVGGGPAGNLPAGALVRFAEGPHNAGLVPSWAALAHRLRVAQPAPAHGGTAAEALSEAQGRAIDALAAVERAVTLADFEALALATPGVPVARARAIADYHPELPCFPAHGAVTVIVVPQCPAERPAPGPELLAAVARFLERRRSLTTELHVIGPRFTRVAVSAQLRVAALSLAQGLVERAQAALRAFLHPLSGGPDGGGWPIGRDLYRAEVQALLGGLPGVEGVEGLGLQGEDDPEPRCGNLPICPDSLLVSGEHRITILERSTP